MKSIAIGLDNLVLPSEKTKQRVIEAASQGVLREDGEKKTKWRRGELEFEGLMRFLDNAVSEYSIFSCFHANKKHLTEAYLPESWKKLIIKFLRKFKICLCPYLSTLAFVMM